MSASNPAQSTFATWDKAATLRKEREHIEQEIGEADKLLEQAESQHEATTAPLYAGINAIKQADIAAERARRDLWDTCAYPELRDRLNVVTKQFCDLQNQRFELERQAADMRQFAETDRHEIRFAAKKAKQVELSERADRRDTKVESLKADAAELRPQIEQLEEEEKRIRKQMLEP